MSFDRKLPLSFESAIERVTEVLKQNGFGVLTRIDFHEKIREKLGHELPRTAILGACNPGFAYAGYQQDRDMLLLIPCNVVVEETGPTEVTVRMVKPSAMIEALESPVLRELASKVDESLSSALQSL
jgi:uncharacterized protein (DUF302 family)